MNDLFPKPAVPAHDENEKKGQELAKLAGPSTSGEVAKSGVSNSPAGSGVEGDLNLTRGSVSDSSLIGLANGTLPVGHRGSAAGRTVEQITSPTVYGLKDYVPFSQRPLLRQILDLPGELKNLFAPAFEYSIKDIRNRVSSMWHMDEPQLSQIVNQKLLDHLIAMYERRQGNKYAFVEPLQREYRKYCDSSDCQQALQAEVWQKKKEVVFTCLVLDKAGATTRHNSPPSEDETKSFFVTVLAFADYLASVSSGPTTLLVQSQGRTQNGHFKHTGIWWSDKIAHQFGLGSGQMKIKLHDQ